MMANGDLSAMKIFILVNDHIHLNGTRIIYTVKRDNNLSGIGVLGEGREKCQRIYKSNG